MDYGKIALSKVEELVPENLQNVNLKINEINMGLAQIINYNVKSFGAKGNGVDNDIVAIQSAVDKASEDGGGTVYFPKGIYLINQPIYLPSNVRLLGVSKEESTIKIMDGSTQRYGVRGGYYVEPWGTDSNYSNHISYNIAIENLSFDGNRDNRGDKDIVSDMKLELVMIAWTDGVIIRNCAFNNSVNQGISTDCCAEVLVENCTVDNVYPLNPLNSGQIIGAPGNGISLSGGLCNFIDDLDYDNLVVKNNTISNIWCIGVSIVGKDIAGTPTEYYDVYKVLIENNITNHCASGIAVETGQGMWLNAGGHDIIIRGNRVINCDSEQSTIPAIWLDDKSYNCEVSNNYIENVNGGGILARGFDTTIASNIIKNFRGQGIAYNKNYYTNEWCTNMICKNNTIANDKDVNVNACGIVAYFCDELLVQGNKISNMTYDTSNINNKYSGQGTGIVIIDKGNKATVVDNIVTDVTNRGIAVFLTSTNSLKKLAISKNTIINCDDVGLLLYTTNASYIIDAIITNNIIYDNRDITKMVNSIDNSSFTYDMSNIFNNLTNIPIKSNFDINTTPIVIKSPDGTNYNLSVNNDGVLSVALPLINKGLSLYLKGIDFTNSPQTTIWTDNSGTGNNASVYNFAYTTSSGSDGSGRVVFDASNDEVNIANPINCSGTNLTFEIKVKSALASGNGTYIRRDGDTTKGYYILKEQGGKYQFQILDHTTAQTVAVTSSTSVNITTDTVITVTVSPTYVKLYVNGVLERTSNNLITDELGAGTLRIGTAGGYEQFNGSISYVRIYNQTLNDTEVLNNYKALKLAN